MRCSFVCFTDDGAELRLVGNTMLCCFDEEKVEELEGLLLLFSLMRCSVVLLRKGKNRKGLFSLMRCSVVLLRKGKEFEGLLLYFMLMRCSFVNSRKKRMGKVRCIY